MLSFLLCRKSKTCGTVSRPKNRDRLGLRAAIVLAASSAAPAVATTYYVSPAGSDQNAGTSASAPWSSVNKVDASTFQPGDQILFQYGSSFNASLAATSSGTTAAPIVYGAYGNSALGNPTFLGSDPIASSAFTSVTGTTYQTTNATPINWIYDNHQFTREAQDATGSSSPASDLSFVESTPGSFYYNSGNGQLFVNPGTSITGQTITAATRQDAINSNGMSNLVFKNLNTSETAADQAGYGIRIQNSSNVQVLNSTVSLAGKHNVGVVDTVGFVGTNIVANGSAPDQGFGGASAVATYSDTNGAVPTSLNNTSVWTNLTYLNANGAYPAFVSHGNAGGIASTVINNLVSLNGYGTGAVIYSTSASQTTLLNGARVDSNTIEVDTNNSVVNNVIATGGGASIVLNGSHTVVQNSTFNGTQGDTVADKPGAVEDEGTNNIIRFNVVNLGNAGQALTVGNANSQTQLYGNIVRLPGGGDIADGLAYSGTGTLSSNYNIYSNPVTFAVEPTGAYLSYAQWQAMGDDANSLTTDANFTNPASGDFTLASGSPAIGLYTGTLDSTLTVANSLLSAPNANGSYNAGINPAAWPTLSSLQTQLILYNGMTNTITPTGNTLTIGTTGLLLSGSTSTLNLVGSVVNAGTFVSLGGLIESGNFNNSGSATFVGSQIWTPGTVFTNLGGYAAFQSDTGGSIAPSGALAVNVSSGLVSFTSTQHLNALTISAGANVRVTNSSSGRSIILTPSLFVAGHLDLGGNDLIAQGGSLSAVTALVKQGFNLVGGGGWNGSGISSSTAGSDIRHLTALGVILNTSDGTTPLYGSGTTLGLFDGISPAATDVLVRYTYVGDANLDGKVDGSDYARIDNGFLLKLTGWYNGDFNYDSVVDGSDYTLIDNTFNRQTAIMTATLASPTAQVAVPEPANCAVILVTTLTLISRRRRSTLALS